MGLAELKGPDKGRRDITDFSRKDICSFLLRKLQFHHRETFLHSIRVSSLCEMLSTRLGLPEERREILLRSALLHDIGKLRIERTLMDKQSTLSNEEWNILKGHCRLGVEILEISPLKKQVDLEVILYHHENLDGTGYYGLTDRELSLEIKIIRVADSFDAMTQPRVYRRAISIIQAFEELYRWSDIHYDPCTPSMGVIYRVKVPNGGWRTPTVSQEQRCPSRGGI